MLLKCFHLQIEAHKMAPKTSRIHLSHVLSPVGRQRVTYEPSWTTQKQRWYLLCRLLKILPKRLKFTETYFNPCMFWTTLLKLKKCHLVTHKIMFIRLLKLFFLLFFLVEFQGKPKFICDVCGKHFLTKDRLNNHRMVIGFFFCMNNFENISEINELLQPRRYYYFNQRFLQNHWLIFSQESAVYMLSEKIFTITQSKSNE